MKFELLLIRILIIYVDNMYIWYIIIGCISIISFRISYLLFFYIYMFIEWHSSAFIPRINMRINKNKST